MTLIMNHQYLEAGDVNSFLEGSLGVGCVATLYCTIIGILRKTDWVSIEVGLAPLSNKDTAYASDVEAGCVRNWEIVVPRYRWWACRRQSSRSVALNCCHLRQSFFIVLFTITFC